MKHTYTESLRCDNQKTWEAAVSHRFVTELFDGSIDDSVMAGYLVQDYRFLDSFLVLLGSAVATADSLEPRLKLARFVGEISGDENTYFMRSFQALGVSESQRCQIRDTKATAAFKALFRDAAETRNYAAILAVLLVTEWLYLDWATNAPAEPPNRFVHAEWIQLHDYPQFHEIVAFLRSELDRVGPSNHKLVEDFFSRAVNLELAFFDATYAHPLQVTSA